MFAFNFRKDISTYFKVPALTYRRVNLQLHSKMIEFDLFGIRSRTPCSSKDSKSDSVVLVTNEQKAVSLEVKKRKSAPIMYM